MIQNDTIENKILDFKGELAKYSATEIVQKRLIFGECQILDSDQYLMLRITVAKFFNIHPNEVIVVGSAKLGFSIAPHKKYKVFGDSSDIDVVIVSDSLFSKIWSSIYTAWKNKVFWEKELDFKDYLFQGWIRPDKFPPSKSFTYSDEWWEFFREATSSGKFGPYKISGALYKDWNFLEHYQNSAVQLCKDEFNR